MCDCLQGGVASCWKNCPNWTEWATGASPYFWVTSPEFRRRACPCEHGQVTSTDSRVFQADRADGHCVQARLPEGTNTIAWDLLYFCLLVALLLGVFSLRKWCGSRKSSRGIETKTNWSEEPGQVHMEDKEENVVWVILIILVIANTIKSLNLFLPFRTLTCVIRKFQYC